MRDSDFAMAQYQLRLPTMIVLVLSVVASVVVLAEEQDGVPTGSASESAPSERSYYGSNGETLIKLKWTGHSVS